MLKLTYTEEMKQQDALWQDEKENLDVMEQLYNEIVKEAKSKGFTGVVYIYDGPTEKLIEVHASEEAMKQAHLGNSEYDANVSTYGYCKPLIEKLEEMLKMNMNKTLVN